MATITRTEAIEQIQEVLKAYENKIRDIMFDTEMVYPPKIIPLERRVFLL